MDCKDCVSYRRGAGSPACLKCNKYGKIIVQSAKRQTIQIDVMPQTIIEALPDTKQMHSIMDILRAMPLDQSTPIIQYYLLGATLQEIADYHHITRQAVDKKNKLTLNIIKESVSTGCIGRHI